MNNDTHAYSSGFNLPVPNRGRYHHKLWHTNHLGMMTGLLFPLDQPIEVLPGDTFKLKQRTIVRAAAALPVPVMDTLTMSVFAFYVPNRIVYSKFDQFIMNLENDGIGSNYLKDTSLVIPYIAPSGGYLYTSEYSLLDFYGVPAGTSMMNQNICTLISEGYYKIWNRWFRYDPIQPEIALYPNPVGGYISYAYTTAPTFNYAHCISNYLYGSTKLCLAPVNKRADVFTRVLPSPTRGETTLLNLSIPTSYSGTLTDVRGLFSTAPGGQSGIKTVSADTAYDVGTNKAYTIGASSNNDKLVGFSSLYGGTVSDLINAFAIYKLKTLDAQYGSRIGSFTLGHFGVNVPDARVQEPELLGMFEFDLNVNQINQTSKTDSTDYLGTVGAQSITNDFHSVFTKSFVEFGYIHLLGCIRIKHYTYAQGLTKNFKKNTRFNFFFPTLANIPDQPVNSYELYNNPGTTLSSDVFGYQEAWYEYKHIPSRVAANFRPQYTGAYDMWTYTVEFSSQPVLSASFLYEDKSSVDRAMYFVQDLDTPGFLVDIGYFLDAYRTVPIHSDVASLKGIF